VVADGLDHVTEDKEENLDRDFFTAQLDDAQLSKLKLNKGEKRALKFLLKREMGDAENIDLAKFIKDTNIVELKKMLASETKKMTSQHKKYEETGGGHKHKNVGCRKIGNNSNKLINYQQFFDQDN